MSLSRLERAIRTANPYHFGQVNCVLAIGQMNLKAVATLVITAIVLAACSVVSSPAWAGGAVGTVVGTVTAGDQPHSIAYDPSNRYLYVTNFGSNTVSVIDGATNAVVGSTITVGLEPYGIAYDPANGYLYVANYGSSIVSVISTGSTSSTSATTTSSTSSGTPILGFQEVLALIVILIAVLIAVAVVIRLRRRPRPA